ncbi:hypothetical protein BH11GEM1_BH11GEM1_26610 [soil metagenome]
MKRFTPGWIARWFSRWRPRRWGGSSAADSHSPTDMMPMLDCEAVMRQLWDYLDAELTPQGMIEIQAHLGMCKRCYPQYTFERAFLNALAARRPTHSNPDRLQTSLTALLRDHGMREV